MDIGDFVIVQQFTEQGKAKKFLIKVTSVKNTKGHLVNDTMIKDPVDFTFAKEEVIANLGKAPQFGSAYGVKIAPVFDQHFLKPWGEVTWKRDVTKEERKHLITTLTKWASLMANEGLASQISLIDIEISPAQGRYSGWYKYHSEKQNCIKFHPESLLEGLKPLLAHEYGHHVWFCLMDDSQRAKWVERYYNTVKQSRIKKDKVLKIIKTLSNYTSIADFLSTEGDDDGFAAMAIDHLLQLTSLNKDGLNTLLKTNKFIYSHWENKVCSLAWGEPEEVVTDYARDNPEELFAETFSLYYTEKNALNKTFRKAMERTIHDVAKD